jgi:hypothetical protein
VSSMSSVSLIVLAFRCFSRTSLCFGDGTGWGYNCRSRQGVCSRRRPSLQADVRHDSQCRREPVRDLVYGPEHETDEHERQPGPPNNLGAFCPT